MGNQAKQRNKVELLPQIEKGVHKGYTALVTPVPSNASAKPTTNEDRVDKNTATGSNNFVRWGDGNAAPKKVMEDLRKSSVIKPALKTRARIHFGAGPLPFKKVIVGSEVVMERILIPDVEDWLDEVEFTKSHFALALDMETFYWGIPEFILNKTLDEIVGYNHIKTCYSRLRTNKSGLIDGIVTSTKFNASSLADENRQEVALYDYTLELKDQSKKFVTPLFYPSADFGVNYPITDWDSIRQNGWLDLAEMVPRAKNRIHQNQAVIAYQIEIPEDYFARLDPEWIGKTPTQQRALKKKVEKSFKDFLSKPESYGSSMITYYPISQDGTEMPSIKITPIGQAFKEGMYLPDAAAANFETLFAIGLSPALQGIGLPNQKDGGSGSFVREELWKMQALMEPERNITLAPLRLISKLNKWPEKFNKGERIYWNYGDITTLRTLDLNPKGKEESITGEQ